MEDGPFTSMIDLFNMVMFQLANCDITRGGYVWGSTNERSPKISPSCSHSGWIIAFDNHFATKSMAISGT